MYELEGPTVGDGTAEAARFVIDRRTKTLTVRRITTDTLIWVSGEELEGADECCAWANRVIRKTSSLRGIYCSRCLRGLSVPHLQTATKGFMYVNSRNA